MIPLEDALAQLKAAAEPGRAEEMARYHKQTRVVYRLANPLTNDLTKAWRQSMGVEDRVTLADALW